jgi:hypothetical protein
MGSAHLVPPHPRPAGGRGRSPAPAGPTPRQVRHHRRHRRRPPSTCPKVFGPSSATTATARVCGCCWSPARAPSPAAPPRSTAARRYSCPPLTVCLTRSAANQPSQRPPGAPGCAAAHGPTPASTPTCWHCAPPPGGAHLDRRDPGPGGWPTTRNQGLCHSSAQPRRDQSPVPTPLRRGCNYRLGR